MKYLAYKLWNFIRAGHYLLLDWMEWQDAKVWAKDFRPGWVHIATKAKRKEIRMIYRDKIMKAYQRWWEDGKA